MSLQRQTSSQKVTVINHAVHLRGVVINKRIALTWVMVTSIQYKYDLNRNLLKMCRSHRMCMIYVTYSPWFAGTQYVSFLMRDLR